MVYSTNRLSKVSIRYSLIISDPGHMRNASCGISITVSESISGLSISVADPELELDPDPDFRPPGPGDISTSYGSESFYDLSSKNSEKNLDSYCVVTSFMTFFFKNLCKVVASKSNKQKK
jgi:hypothetical protein